AKISVLPMTEFHFLDTPNATYKVPGATNPDKWSPQWGIFTLTFTVSENDNTKLLAAEFATQVDGTQIVGMNVFKIGFHRAPPFEVSQPVIDVGRLDDLSGDREYTIVLYSSTRGPSSEFGDFDMPDARVQAPLTGGEPGKFIEVTKMERIPDAELPDLMAALATKQRSMRVMAAYRATVVLRPKVGDVKLDIGQLARNINFVSGSGSRTG